MILEEALMMSDVGVDTTRANHRTIEKASCLGGLFGPVRAYEYAERRKQKDARSGRKSQTIPYSQ